LPVLPVSTDLVFEGRKEKYHPVNKVSSRREGPDYWRRSYTTALAADVYLLDQTLILTGTQRWGKHINEFHDVPIFAWLPPTPQGKIAKEERAPSLGFRWHPRPFITVKGNAGTYYRLPTFLELVGNFGSVTGNAKLEPEKGTNRDVGLVFTFDRLGPLQRVFLEAVYITNKVENLILFFPNSQRTSKPTNIGSADITGWELSLSSRVGSMLHLSGSYTRLDTKDTSDIPSYRGNQLPSRPADDISVSASVPWRRWRLSYELHYIGANYLDQSNMQYVSARSLHNLALRFEIPVEGFALTLEGRNLSDNKISDVSGFPLPGRTFYSTASYRR
jgi:iron complex outermembrane receptor protein